MARAEAAALQPAAHHHHHHKHKSEKHKKDKDKHKKTKHKKARRASLPHSLPNQCLVLTNAASFFVHTATRGKRPLSRPEREGVHADACKVVSTMDKLCALCLAAMSSSCVPCR